MAHRAIRPSALQQPRHPFRSRCSYCYPQGVATALALRHSWQRDDLITFGKRLGLKVTSKDLADHADSTTPDLKTRKASSDRPRKTPSKT